MTRLSATGFSVMMLLVAASGTGCTSVLTSASLRDLVWDVDEHASESASAVSDGDPSDAAASSPGDPVNDPPEAVTVEADAERREAAIEEAVSRLAKLDDLDDEARASLMETLDRTQQEDWPAVIDAFAETLALTGPAAMLAADSNTPETAADDPAIAGREPAPPEAADPHVVAKAALDDGAQAAPEPVAPEPAEPLSPPAAEPAATRQPEAEAAADPAGVVDPVAAAALTPAEPAPARRLAIHNACFATRVQAWGVVDRFPADRFRPGQEVIVYFELDGLSAGESPAGHTTCIDATLRLVAADGQVLHTWSFEPIAETCRARRHDYFARYVVRLPETVTAGDCRVECGVTDTLSGEVATTSLPLELVAGDTDR